MFTLIKLVNRGYDLYFTKSLPFTTRKKGFNISRIKFRFQWNHNNNWGKNDQNEEKRYDINGYDTHYCRHISCQTKSHLQPNCILYFYLEGLKHIHESYRIRDIEFIWTSINPAFTQLEVIRGGHRISTKGGEIF